MKQGWKIKMLGEVCELSAGGDVPKDDLSDYQTEKHPIPIYANGEKNEGLYGFTSTAKIFKPSITVSARGTIGFTVKRLKPFVPIVRLIVVTPYNLNELYLDYLDYSLRQIDFKHSGTSIPQLTVPMIKNYEIPLPPLPEQQRIVTILDECFSAIEQSRKNSEQNLQHARELFESYLQGVLEKKGEGWEEKTLEDLADENCTLSYGIVQPGEEFAHGLPVIRPTDLTTRFINIKGLKRIDPKLAEGYKRTKLIGDEILLCVRGTTGVVSIATPELKDANVTRGIVPIRFDSKIIDQEFGYYLLISNYVQRQIQAKTYGAALMQINIGDLRKISTPYPSIKEQQSIVRKLDALRAQTQQLEAVYRQKIADLDELKKSILQRAFSGELGVTSSL